MKSILDQIDDAEKAYANCPRRGADRYEKSFDLQELYLTHGRLLIDVARAAQELAKEDLPDIDYGVAARHSAQVQRSMRLKHALKKLGAE